MPVQLTCSGQREEEMKQYLKSLAGLASAPETLVQMSIGGSIVALQLAEVPTYLKTNGLSDKMPNAVMVDGVKTGAFPVIEPRTQEAALALSAVVGYPVPVGDGVRFATQKQAGDVARALKALGTTVDELVMEWQLGKAQGATAKQLKLPLATIQPTVEAQMADSPF